MAPTHQATSRDTVLRIIAIVIVGGWVGYLLLTEMPQISFAVFPRTLAMHLMFAGLAAVYAGWLAIARRPPYVSPIHLGALALLGAYALATLTSESWRVSLEPVLLLGAAVLLFYALCDLPHLGATELRRALMLVGAALSLYAIWIVGNDYYDYVTLVRRVEGVSGSNIFPPTVPRVHDVSDHPNVLAMLLALIMPFYALSAVRAPSRWERAAGALGLLAAGIAIFLTLSRGGWLGAGAGIAFTLVASWLTVLAHQREEGGFAPSWQNALPRDVSPTALATIGGALVLAVAGTLAFLSSSATRPGWLFRGSLSPRQDAWDAGLDMFADRALVGWGPHTFGLLYPQYSGKFLVHTQHAHNGFLQVAVDAGLVGLAALAVLGIAVVYVLLKTWRGGTLEQRLLAVACGGSLLAFSIHNQLDAGNMWKAPPIALALVGAIIAVNYRERARPSAPAGERALRPAVLHVGRIAVAAAPVVVIAVVAVAWWRIDTAHYDYYKGVQQANVRLPGETDELREAIARLQDAVDADSSMVVYRLQLGQAQAHLFMETGERAALDGAVTNTEQAVRLDKRSDIARANLARVYELAGRDEDAAREAQITRLAVNHVPPVIAVAEVYEDMGYTDDAVDTYAQVISMDASLADSAYWEGTPWRREHFDEIIAASSLGINPCTFGSYLVQAHRGDASQPLDPRLPQVEDGCKLLVLSLPNDLVLRVALAKILAERGKTEEALTHLTFAVDRQPDFGPARTEMGRWYADRGNLAEARRQWVTGAELDEAESVLLLGESYPAATRPTGLRDRLEELVLSTGSSVQNDLITVVYYRLRWGRISPL